MNIYFLPLAALHRRGLLICCLLTLVVFSSGVCPAQAPEGIEIIARDPTGHGLRRLLKKPVETLVGKVLYLVGGADSISTGTWAFDRMAEIERRTLPHTPKRFLVECDAMSKAAGVSRRDGRYANLFAERFHCSGVAVRGKATVDGRVLHARVLDYMRDINLQRAATVTVFMPEGRNTWVTLGYAAFIGTVTAMNEKGLAVGEMGGGGEGDWDGIPMTFLLRDIMERASTVDQALEILRSAPRTCEYYYVFSDKSRAMAGVHCDPRQMTVLHPGKQHPLLPLVPEDTVLVSGPDRAKVLSRRIQASYGKIDVPTMIELIKRPVSMSSNLHDAIFAAETLDMWFADAGKHTVACDEPYAYFNLAELVRFYKTTMAEKPDK
jgi:hypothetical protein